MAALIGACHFCEQSVFANQPYGHPVRGWEVLRPGGGANRIAMRERSDGIVAHAACIERRAAERRRGISDDQEELL